MYTLEDLPISFVLGSLCSTRWASFPTARDWSARINSLSGISVSVLISCQAQSSQRKSKMPGITRWCRGKWTDQCCQLVGAFSWGLGGGMDPTQNILSQDLWSKQFAQPLTKFSSEAEWFKFGPPLPPCISSLQHMTNFCKGQTMLALQQVGF